MARSFPLPHQRYWFPLWDPTVNQWGRGARVLRWLTLLWVGMGLVILLSASYGVALGEGGPGWRYLAIQTLWVCLGLAGFNWVVEQPLEGLTRRSGLVFLGVLGLLFLTLVPGLGVTVNGATRWLGVGPFLIQPSELLKPLLVLQAARVFGQWHRLAQVQRTLWLGCFAAGVGIILVQPNLSTAAICGMALWILAFVAGLPLGGLGITAGGGLGVVLLSLVANTYQRQRITSFLNPWADAMGQGYQLVQSLLAIANGSLWGQGLGFSQQKIQYLPIQYTDFIFAVFAEEFGFVGCTLLLGFLGIYGSVGLWVGLKARSRSQCLVATGAVLFLVGQALFNIAVTVGLAPTTGLPLPLVSYGGSSMLANLVLAGLLIRVAREVAGAKVVALSPGGEG